MRAILSAIVNPPKRTRRCGGGAPLPNCRTGGGRGMPMRGSATITMVIWGVRFLRRFLGSFQPYQKCEIGN